LVVLLGAASVVVVAPQAPARARAHGATACAESAPDAASALAAAQVCDGQVEDASRRSPSAQVFANPDGTFTAEENALPVQAQRADGSWAKIDLTLQPNPDGSVSPAVSPVPLTLAGEGSEQLATVVDPATQQRFTLGWPHPLPAPRLWRDTATYP